MLLDSTVEVVAAEASSSNAEVLSGSLPAEGEAVTSFPFRQLYQRNVLADRVCLGSVVLRNRSIEIVVTYPAI